MNVTSIARALTSPMLVLTAGLSVGLVFGLLPPDRLGIALAAFVAASLSAACVWRPMLLLHLIYLSAALGSIFREIERADVGGTSVSLSGLRWIAVGALALGIAALRWRRWPQPGSFWLWAGFSVWMGARYVAGPFDVRGFKDVVFYLFPLIVGTFSCGVAARASDRSLRRFEAWCMASVAVPWLLFGVMFATGHERMTPDGPKGILESRPIASFALIVFCLALAVWRHGDSRRRRRWAIATVLVAFGLVMFTLSRAATATAVLLLVVHRVPPQRLGRLVPRAVAALAAAVLLMLAVPSLRERTFYRTPRSLDEAWAVLDTSGRGKMWAITAQLAKERPLVGWGPGTVRPRVAEGMVWNTEIVPTEYPPHNEYLQVFHDGGAIGLALLLLALGALSWHSLSLWRQGNALGNSRLAVQGLAAWLALLALMANALIDNTLHYYTVMAPVFTLLGIAAGVRHQLAGKVVRT